MICRLQLIQLLSTVCSAPPPRRGFGGISPQTNLQGPKLERGTLQYISGAFVNNIKPSRTKAKLPYWKLSSDGFESAAYLSFVHKKTNLTQMKQEFKYLRAQWHSQPKILFGSKCLILGELQHFVW